MSIEQILEKKLRLDPARSTDEWTAWEHKTWNIHRGVLLWKPREEIRTAPRIVTGVREAVRSLYKRSWWRGFAFGAVITLPEPPEDIGKLEAAIDTRNNPKGVWQWVILETGQPRAAFAIHTWIEGYLSGTYRELLARYEGLGFRVGHFRKEKDSLMKFLTFAASLKGHRLEDFRNPGPGPEDPS